MKRLRRVRPQIVIVVGALVFTSCGATPERAQKKAAGPIVTTPQGIQYGGHLRMGYTLAPMSLDAVLGRSGGDAVMGRRLRRVGLLLARIGAI